MDDKLQEILEQERWRKERPWGQYPTEAINEHNECIARIETAAKYRINDLKRTTKIMEETILSQGKSLKWHGEQWKIKQDRIAALEAENATLQEQLFCHQCGAKLDWSDVPFR